MIGKIAALGLLLIVFVAAMLRFGLERLAEERANRIANQPPVRSYQAEQDAETNGRVGRFIHDHFNDPDSVKDLTVNRPYRLKNGHMNYIFYCRAKNGFGAYSGLHVYEFEMASK